MTYRANDRREAIRQLAELRTRLDAAEDALTAAEASLKQAHTRFDAADDRVVAAEDALHAAYADREQARRASAMVERLQRRVSELTDRLAKMPEAAHGSPQRRLSLSMPSALIIEQDFAY